MNGVEFIDHYDVLGLPSGEEGAKLSEQEITRAYRRKAKQLHPDKRPNDNPDNANANFVKIQNSYQVLKDRTKRKSFDDHLLLRVREKRIEKPHHRRRRKQENSAKNQRRKKMMSDLEEAERGFADRAEEIAYRNKMNEEIARIVARENEIRKRSGAPLCFFKFQNM